MKVSVIGVGYVGLVTGACLAELGHDVICVDNNAGKIDRLKAGRMPIYEPGLAEIVARNAAAGRLEFTTDLARAVHESLVVFIAVGTPSSWDGSADLSSVYAVARQIGAAMKGHRVIVGKSTVPVGTHQEVIRLIAEQTSCPFGYVSNPEFLKEGAAIEDFLHPDRVIIGTRDPQARGIMWELYAPCMRRGDRMICMDPASAELTKYAANAMLATRISFMNELSLLCEKVGADIEQVRRGVGSDERIGSAFLYAGVGYGGSCFPKDVSALLVTAYGHDCPLEIVKAAREANHRQRQRFVQKVVGYYRGRQSQTTLAVWGLAFKANTDDIRDSPAIYCVEQFLCSGLNVRAYDPQALEAASAWLDGRPQVFRPCYQQHETLQDADGLVVLTDWPQFRVPDLSVLAQSLRGRVIFDGRNLYDPVQVRAAGLQYHSVGR